MKRMLAAAALSGAACAGVQAAGGHFDVDDATVLETGHCQSETWFLRSPSEGSHALHEGGACRVGPVELGVNVDHFEVGGSPALTTAGPQLKWVADPLFQRLSAGIVWAVSLDTSGHAGAANTLYLPVTLWSGERVQVHLNAGTDWTAGDVHTPRWGVSGEWALNDRFSLLAERSLITEVRTARLGSRFNFNSSVCVDLSVAKRSSARHASYGLGLNWDFERH